MIEAVNSVVSNAQLARVSADQVATLNSFAADQPVVETVARAPVAPYISPYVSVDTRFDTAVIQIRDSDTGDVLTQFPSEPTLQSRQAQAAREEAARQASLGEPSNNAPQIAQTPTPQTQRVDSSTTVQNVIVAQQAAAPTQENSTAGAAQVAIAALSAGAQAAQVATTTSVTA